MKQLILIYIIILTIGCICGRAQAENLPQGVIKVFPQDCNGLPINDVTILISKGNRTSIADSIQLQNFLSAFNLFPGTAFNQSIANISIMRLMQEPSIKTASYQLYSRSIGMPVDIVVSVELLNDGEHKSVNGKYGMAETHSLRDFPLIYQNDKSEVTLIFNGAVGLFNDKNGFFGHGEQLTQGNPIATDPEGFASRFWGEAFIEPGIAGIVELGRSQIYAYGAVSALISGRNTSDAYSAGGHIYYDFEKLYGGLLFSRLGHNRDMSVNISAGRQEFQLNDGFIISRFSGSTNAGPRAGTYLNPRRSLHMSALAKWSSPHWTSEFFYIQPEELTRHSEVKNRYMGIYAGYDNKGWNPGLAFLSRVHGKGDYYLPDGKRLSHKGLMAINPKLWINDIAGTGLFFKSEYVYEWHTSGGMSANAWYAGLGMDFKKVAWTPRIYYRYAFMQGDNPESSRYTRFDPIMTGGLAEWVQGINMCKVVGLGNVVTHRLEALLYPSKSINVEVDYYHLRADSRYNAGGASALSNLSSKHLGDEITVQLNWNINPHFLLLGLASVAIPGAGIKDALPHPVKAWSTFQLNLFMFF